jgi:hypothetical protein
MSYSGKKNNVENNSISRRYSEIWTFIQKTRNRSLITLYSQK